MPEADVRPERFGFPGSKRKGNSNDRKSFKYATMIRGETFRVAMARATASCRTDSYARAKSTCHKYSPESLPHPLVAHLELHKCPLSSIPLAAWAASRPKHPATLFHQRPQRPDNNTPELTRSLDELKAPAALTNASATGTPAPWRSNECAHANAQGACIKDAKTYRLRNLRLFVRVPASQTVLQAGRAKQLSPRQCRARC